MTDVADAFQSWVRDAAFQTLVKQRELERELGIRLEIDHLEWSEDRTQVTFHFKPYDYDKHRGSEDFDE